VRPGRAADHSPPSGPHRACNGITLLFYLTLKIISLELFPVQNIRNGGHNSDSLWAELSEIRIPMGDAVFCSRTYRPRGPPGFLHKAYEFFPRGKTAGALC